MRWGEGGRYCLDFSRPLLMGILNVTPDSFSGDGVAGDVTAAVGRGVELARNGADVVDVGGESTRPGADAVSVAEELSRIIPVVRALSRRLEIPVSVDTSKPEVMEEALLAGAAMINDVSALGVVDASGGVAVAVDGAEAEAEEHLLDRRKVSLLAGLDVPVCLMHRRGTPKGMQDNPWYRDVVREVYHFLERRIAACRKGGIDRRRLIVDVGIGFGKSAGHNLELMRHHGMFSGLGQPLMLGVSRKRIVGHLSGVADPGMRDTASHALAVLGMRTGVRMFRVHDVAGARQALTAAWGWMNDGERRKR
ncbi:MAG: dihydropteroate synthase family protein [Magnetococcales bacterium]|nr:dihydropteroate synthase family protein [Magnetococcales bacterium]